MSFFALLCTTGTQYCYVLTFRNRVLLCSYLQEHSTVMFIPTGTQEHRMQGSISGLYHTRCKANCYDKNLSFANTWPRVRCVFRASDPEKNFTFLVSSYTGTLLCTHYVWRVVSIFMAQRPNIDKILTYSISVCMCTCVWELSQNVYMLIMIIFPSYLKPYSFCICVRVCVCVIFCLTTLSVYNVIYGWQ